jgi:hypothetical protein
MRHHGIILRFVVSTFVGAVVTVAVAIACAEFLSVPAAYSADAVPRWRFVVPSDWPRPPERSVVWARPGLRRVEGSVVEGRGEYWIVENTSYGWPFVALDAGHTRFRKGPTTTQLRRTWSVVAPEWLWESGQPHVWPGLPRWPGFVLDTTFYGAVVFVVWPLAGRVGRRGWGRVRARARRQRGECVSCGYDLAETTGPCPECGRTRP